MYKRAHALRGNMYDTVIFDMDGTLSDTLLDLQASLNYALKLHGLPERSYEEVRSFVGDGIRMLVSRGLPEGKKDLVDVAYAEFKDYYKDHLADRTRPYDGINELVDTLYAKGIKMGIVSNKLEPMLNELVNKFWGNKISVAVGIIDGRPQKPEANMPNDCLKALGSQKSTTLYLGDSPVDVLCAKNAGLHGVFCTWGFASKERLTEVGATEFIDKPSELLKYFG